MKIIFKTFEYFIESGEKYWNYLTESGNNFDIDFNDYVISLEVIAGTHDSDNHMVRCYIGADYLITFSYKDFSDLFEVLWHVVRGIYFGAYILRGAKI